MGLKEKILGFIKQRFGRKLLSSPNQINNTDFIEQEITSYNMDDFNESLKVENVSNLSPSYDFQELSNEIKAQLHQTYREFRETLEGSEEYIEMKEKEMYGEGYSGNMPFICYAEMGSDGKIEATIIVTEKSVSRTGKNSDGSKSYEEYRKDKNGYKAVSVSNGETAYVSSKNPIAKKDMEKIKAFRERIKNDINSNTNNMSKEELLAYQQVLKAYGVDDFQIDLKDKDKFASPATGCFGEDGRGSAITCVYNKEQNSSSVPILINIATEKDGKMATRNFRSVGQNKYIDENSFELVNGQPSYKIVSLEKINEIAESRGLDVSFFDRLKKHENEEKPMIPKTAEDIHDKFSRQAEKEKEKANGEREEGEEEGDHYPSHTLE